ncbi:MAG TPA: cohesin domain-containing protein [Rhodocyclaceae bacterium]|nr:cohesin domain-containing protein [Rhodocyclaceae bacterium]
MKKLFPFALVLLASVMVAGCAGYWAQREADELFARGKTEEGMDKLKQALAEDPANIQYRISYMRHRLDWVSQLLAAADTGRREGRLSDAERSFRKVLEVDPNHAAARQGLDALVMERSHRQSIAEADALFKKGAEGLDDATELVRRVLAENPRQRDAIALKGRIDEARTKEKTPEARLAATFRKPITLEFRDAPLKSVFDVVSKVSGLNFFFDKDIRPDLKATILARNTTVEDAIRLLLVTNQLEQKVLNENSILIYPNTAQKLKEYRPLSVRTFYLANGDVKGVSATLKTILKTKDLVVDERLGIIIMRDTPAAIKMAEKLVALQDISDPEVMLDVEILEVQRSRLLELGINWPSQIALAPIAGTGTTVTLNDLRNQSGATTQVTVAATTINARREKSDSNILANPRIRVRNKEKAKIMIGDKVPVITTTSTSTGFVAESVTYVDVGLKLEVEPNIYLDEEVAIKISLEVSSLVKEITSKSGTLSYQIGTRNASTVLRLKDGETQILAGLINDSDRATANRVPLLGEIPVLGRLFGSQKDDAQRSEVVLSITPRVVRSIRRPDLLNAQFDSGTEDSVGSPPLGLSPAEADKEKAAVPAGKPSAPAAGAARPAAAAASPVAPAAANAETGNAVAPSPAPAPAPAPAEPAAAAGGSVRFAWQGSSQVKAGEQFSLALRVTSPEDVRGLPMLISYDSTLVQAVSVTEGDFFKQGGAVTIFNQQIDALKGQVFAAGVRQTVSESDIGIKGTGVVATLTFRALKPGRANIQLTSAAADPSTVAVAGLPVDTTVTVTP